MQTSVILSYIIATILFFLGLKCLSSPKTARKGNFLAVLGMLIAIIVTLLNKEIVDYTFIIAGIIIGSVIGVIFGKKIKMTAMPQMVALLNGFGGGASVLVALAVYLALTTEPKTDFAISMILSLFIGAVTFSGSLVAFGKLQEIIKSAPVVFKTQQLLNVLLALGCLALATLFLINPSFGLAAYLIIIIALVLGVSLVIRIGGADMPVVISLLNSYSGLAAVATGFVLSNYILIVSGALVGASGIVLTRIMCKAMNRSLINVIFGAVGAVASDSGIKKEKRTVARHDEGEAAMVLESAGSVIVIPGYGLAVAQAHYVLQELVSNLIKKGVQVRYAIHPVAGRMPGHMNVLLAEANVPYDLLCDLESGINEDFKATDVALVIGANDVINPAARTQKDSPLSGMPIFNADQARTVIICKRSLSPGFAGVDNELFYDPKTMMIFGDAKESIAKILNLLKNN